MAKRLGQREYKDNTLNKQKDVRTKTHNSMEETTHDHNDCPVKILHDFKNFKFESSGSQVHIFVR